MEALLERQAELDVLEDAAREVAGSRGSLVLVAGEAGIGKTTLVRALRSRAAGAVTFALGSCEPLSVPVPLAPLRELVDADLAFESGDRLTIARHLFDALASRAPVVAVIEDAHWADPMTLDVLRLLAKRVEDTPVGFVVTYRDDEAAANLDLARLLGDLATSPAVRRLPLRPLSQTAVRTLAEPAGVDPVELTRVTGGNPFLVVEAIAAGERIPASVRDAALGRASRLSPEARAVVDGAAVIGQRVAPPLLEAVVPGSAGGVEEALRRGVIVADGAVLGFRHELIREAIEASLSPSRRAELHGRVVSALSAQPAADNARLAHHAELAGLVEEASRYALLAASEAERVGALHETNLQAERALRLGAGLTARDRFDLLVRRAHAANFASTRLEDAVDCAEQAVALAVELEDPAGESRALVALAWALWSLDRLVEARAAAERAVAVLEHASDLAALARAEATQVRIEATAFDPRTAVELGERALERAAKLGLGEMRIDLAVSVGLARGHCGDAAAVALLTDAVRAARNAQLPFQTVRSYVNLVYVAAMLRDHATVDRAAAEALSLFDAYQAPIPGYAVEAYRARSLLDRGRWDELAELAARGERSWASVEAGRDWAGERPALRTYTGLVAARRGDLDAGTALLERAAAEIGGIPESARHGMIRAALAEAAWLRGDRDAVAQLLADARRRPLAVRFVRWFGELALWASRLGVDVEAPADAPPAVQNELAGDWHAAVEAWQEVEAPYEAALAALRGDDRAATAALESLQRLGAAGAARAFARDRAAAGARRLRGPRRSTLAHPAGLTRREQEVLAQLATGATNATIASTLHLSERTIAHHVSAILGKLGADTRMAAVEAARSRGLLGKDGQANGPT